MPESDKLARRAQWNESLAAVDPGAADGCRSDTRSTHEPARRGGVLATVARTGLAGRWRPKEPCPAPSRRILHTLFEMHDGRCHKVANAVGETMELHPHGDAAIEDALIVLANKDDFIDKKAVSEQTIKLNYDRKAEFFGSAVKAAKPIPLRVAGVGHAS